VLYVVPATVMLNPPDATPIELLVAVNPLMLHVSALATVLTVTEKLPRMAPLEPVAVNTILSG